MTRPRFSVVMPVHNKERHVVRSLQSVLTQTESPAEVLVVDDASPDRSIELMRPIADARVRFLRRDEPGPGGYAARNLAIENATSEWIAFLDADDVWAPDHLKVLADTIERFGDGPSCIFSGYERLEHNGERNTDWYSRAGRAPGTRSTIEMLDEWLLVGSPLWMGAVAMRRAVLLDAGLFPAGRARLGGDRVLWLKVILRTPCTFTGAITATYHCDSDNQVTRKEAYTVACLLEEIAAELPSAPPEVARRLKRIFDEEVYGFVRRAWKRGLPITRDDFKGYFLAQAPGKYLLVRLMHAFPLWMPEWARRLLRTLRGRDPDTGLRRPPRKAIARPEAEAEATG